MFNINNRIFYGKSVENGTLICSIDPETSQPVSEGFINEALDAFDGENSKYDFRMYECDDNIYVLAKNKIYKLDNKNTEVIFDNISSLYIYDNKCYYSLFEDNEFSTYELKGSGGIWCYDFNTHDNTEIVNKEAIKNYNSIESISGDVCGVQNIIAEENKIYFLGAFDPTQISVFNEETEEIVNLTDYFRTKMFKKYKDKLYFIDRQHRLRSVSDEGNMDVIINAYVYAFSIYNDKIYYYRVTRDIGHPSELVEFDMTSQTEKIISKSTDAD